MKKICFSLCMLLTALPASAEVDVDTTTFHYALARLGLTAVSAGKYELVKASFSGKLSAEARAYGFKADISAQENMNDQTATDAISEKYGRLRLLASGEGGGDIVDELMPTPTPDDSGRLIYVAPVDAAGQYGVKTRAQAAGKVLLAPLYCERSKILYFIALTYPFAAFSYQSALAELNSYECSKRIPPDKKELETLRGHKKAAVTVPDDDFGIEETLE